MRTATHTRLQSLLAHNFGAEPARLTAEATLGGTLLFDSLDLADLAALIHHEFGVFPPLESTHELQRLDALSAFIDARASSR